jgi:hypothetical protein
VARQFEAAFGMFWSPPLEAQLLALFPMRLTSIVAVAAVSAPLLGGCFGPADSKKPWMPHSQEAGAVTVARGETLAERGSCRWETSREVSEGVG